LQHGAETTYPMNFSTFLINLDHATDRMQQMDNQLQRLNIPYTRISGVLGDLLEEPIEGFDQVGYQIRTGKHRNKHEIGCYLSHIKVFEAFLKTDQSHALILEDDARLPEYIKPLLDSALCHGDCWDLLRLSSSRKGRFIDVSPLLNDHILGINTKVLKSTAAYMISRKGAERCLKQLLPMQWPYDVALDRDWAIGINTACIYPFPVTFSDIPSQIPKMPRIKLLRASTFHIYHLIDHMRRIRYRKRVAKALFSYHRAALQVFSALGEKASF
jgi:glycosyl transferase family 25